MSDLNEMKELIESFTAYRGVLVPLQDSLHALSKTYEDIKNDLENLTKSFSGNVANQLDKIHSTLNSQSKNGQELSKKIDEFSSSADSYARAVDEMTKRFKEVAARLEAVNEIERAAEGMIERLDTLVSEKRTSYNLKDLQKSLDNYNKDVEKVSDFINKDVATVLKENAEKVEAIRRDNEQLAAVVAQQGKAVAELTATFAETSALLKKTLEGGTVNEQYLYDAFDKWAMERRVKIKK